jgi:P27 family predicted phage terminase small subunit
MKPGRKPKPTALKLLNGNPGKRALNTNEPTLTPLIDAEPPRYLGKAARMEWQRLAPQLVAVGLLSEADLALFATYCSAWGDLLEAEKKLRRGGHVSSTGKRSPWFYVKARAGRAAVTNSTIPESATCAAKNRAPAWFEGPVARAFSSARPGGVRSDGGGIDDFRADHGPGTARATRAELKPPWEVAPCNRTQLATCAPAVRS